MGKCLEALGSQQDAVGTPSMRVPFQLPLGLWGRTVKIVIGARGQGCLAFPCQEGRHSASQQCSPQLTLSTSWSLSC